MDIVYYNTLPAYEEYFQPSTVAEALAVLKTHGADAKILAGGTDLLARMRKRAVTPKCILNIAGISGFAGISMDEEGLKVGAMTTLREVELFPAVKKEYRLLYEAVQQMATVQVRNMGTLVGNICHASPGADTPPPLLALEASVKVVGPGGPRIVPLGQFLVGPNKTVLKNDELVAEVQVPRLPASSGSAFLRLTRVAADLSKVNVAVVLTVKGGVCEDARIALGSVAPTAIRAGKAEEVLRGNALDQTLIEKAAAVAAEEIRPITDLRSTREYRQEVANVLVRRAVHLSMQRAGESKGGTR